MKSYISPSLEGKSQSTQKIRQSARRLSVRGNLQFAICNFHFAIPRTLLILLLAVALSASALIPDTSAWGEEGHRFINRVAVEKLSGDVPPFLKAAAARVSYLGPEPDRWREEPELSAATAPDHFIDIDNPEDFASLPKDRYKYAEWLRGKGKDPKAIGFLPYAILEGYEKIEVMFRQWRDPKRASERDQIEQNIIYYSGVVGHFVADGSQPLHATVNYNGWTTTPNPESFSKEPNHSRFETEYVRANIKPEDFSSLVVTSRPVKDPMADIMKFLLESNSHVVELYRMDKTARWDAANHNPESKKFVCARMAAGAQMLSDLIYTAWLNSAEARRRN